MLLAGIEPAFHPSQGCVLSVERRERSAYAIASTYKKQSTTKLRPPTFALDMYCRG